ncbi:hypothetical protein PIIN_06894, partial [Serendipita indica DSM 11827]
MLATSANPVHRLYRTDVPRSIRSNIKELSAHENRIIQLQKTIIELEAQIRVANADFARNQTLPQCVAKINRLPAEILIFIFELALKGCHPDISRLLRVSRRWYNLILDTPFLWARIELITREGVDGEITLPDESYVQACHIRSANAPLRIFLDYRKFPNPYLSVEQQMDRLLRLLRAEDADVSLVTELWEKRRLHDDYFDEEEYYPTITSLAYSKLFDRARALAKELAADRGEHMKRWVEVSCVAALVPEYECGYMWCECIDSESQLFEPLWWPTPRLVKLHLDGEVELPFLNDYEDEDEDEEMQLEELDIQTDY